MGMELCGGIQGMTEITSDSGVQKVSSDEPDKKSGLRLREPVASNDAKESCVQGLGILAQRSALAASSSGSNKLSAGVVFWRGAGSSIVKVCIMFALVFGAYQVKTHFWKSINTKNQVFR